MHRYFIKTPWWVRLLFSGYTWRMRTTEKAVYLTFDDGPHPQITPWVLARLKEHGAEATFFCIGNNVERYPAVYAQVLAEGHTVGNHTQRHLNGWKTDTQAYVADASAARKHIKTQLFRPPYGRIRRAQAKALRAAFLPQKIQVVMWDVLSADFDARTTAQQCAENVLRNVQPGSIVVFHDSEKAFMNLEGVLPNVLRGLAEKGYVFRKITMSET